LQPGQWVTKIGSKRRSSFALKAGISMNYQGLLKLGSITYAIFHCPQHDDPQGELFGQQKQYRYAFACVFVNGQFQCFLRGPGGPDGMADLQLDYLA
jgi:hypothetical protein